MTQFSDTFPGSSLDSGKWSQTTDFNGSVTVASGACTLHGVTGFEIVQTLSSYSLTAAGTDGIQVRITAAGSASPAEAYVLMQDLSSSNGHAFRLDSTAFRSVPWTSSGLGTVDTWSLANTTPVILRFAQNGSNLELSTSTDEGSTWTVQLSVSLTGIDATAVSVILYVQSSGTDASMTLTSVVIAGSVPSTTVADDAEFTPFPTTLALPMPAPSIVTVFA